MTVSDAPSCGDTYSCHSHNSRDVIYDDNNFTMQVE
jgi:hypothetical protein